MTTLEVLDLGVRLFIFGQHAIIIVAVILSVRNRCGAWLVALCICLQFYVLISSPLLEASFPSIRPLALLMATSIPWVFWVFARDIFELPVGNWWVALSWLILVVPKWLLFSYYPEAFPVLLNKLMAAKQVAGMLLVVHALVSILNTYNDDLLELRRSFRLVLAGIAGLTILVIMTVEALVDFELMDLQTLMPELTLFAAVSIALLTLVLGPHVIVHCRELLGRPEVNCGRGEQLISARQAADEQLIKALHEHMASGAYRQIGLTIGEVADELGVPEHQLRKLINSDLGYRNFSAFLQSYRIEHVCEQLLDPSKARIPVLTLALDAGFGSLGPFNRAFKALKGVTPSHYRNQIPANSENS